MLAIGLAIALTAGGAAAVAIAARTPDAHDIPRISTQRPLMTPIPAEETTVDPTITPDSPLPAEPQPTPREGGHIPLRPPAGSSPDRYSEYEHDADDSDDDFDGDREVVKPRVREEDDDDDSEHDTSEEVHIRESSPVEDDAPEDD
ncbi:MAG: hypothetical protein CVT60_04405 [Actinobacteria bacterium HGW-Actinobacteria-10]|jgi:hypothetical protein|nr:MAG: hypothetical protein CVT60_04405 [Actinobacteria bacterium HGW-Actinobacteria-10]